jgi:hypothetical protein
MKGRMREEGEDSVEKEGLGEGRGVKNNGRD